MDEAAVPEGPAGRHVLAQFMESGKNGDRKVSALRSGGTALRAASPALKLQLTGSLLPPIPSLGQYRIRM
eukprot:5113826-Alexandrium_andersonii.AAC.1